MKAAHVFPFLLLLALSACSRQRRPPAPPSSSPAPVALQAAAPSLAPAMATSSAAAPATAPASPTAIPSASPRPASSPAAPASASREAAQPASFNIGVPAGDAYFPFSLAIDSARNLAYVYHADSAEKRPVISVVDLAAREVTRLIRLDRTTPGASGRLLLAPDGKRLYLQENQDYTVLMIDTTTGALRKVLDDVHDAALSDDGRVLYAAQTDFVAAYATADLALGKIVPVWQSKGRFHRLALGGRKAVGRDLRTHGRARQPRCSDRQRTGARGCTRIPGRAIGWA